MATFGVTSGKQEWLNSTGKPLDLVRSFSLRFQIHHGSGLPGDKAHYRTSEVIYVLPRRNNTEYMLQSKYFLSGVSANFW